MILERSELIRCTSCNKDARPRSVPTSSAPGIALATLLALFGPHAGAAPGNALPPAQALNEAESSYADLVDAKGVLDAIDSGLFAEYGGRNRREWDARLRSSRERLATALSGIPAARLSASDARVLTVLQHKLESFAPHAETKQAGRCADRQRKDLSRDALSAALTACFTEIANS